MNRKVLTYLFTLIFYPSFSQQAKLMLPIGHTNRLQSAQFSPDGKKVVTTSSENNTAKIWDANSGKILADLKGHTEMVNSAQFNPDGKKIVTTSEDRTAKIWDARSGLLLADFKGHIEAVYSAQFSPDGKKIVTASGDGTAKIWDTESGKILIDLKGHIQGLNFAQFSPDGKKIVTASEDGIAKIWDASSGFLLANLVGHMKYGFSVQFSPDGKKIVTASVDSTAKIWDASSGLLLAKLKGHKGTVNSVQFSPDGKKIVTGSWDATAKIWDANSGLLLANLKGHNEEVYSAEFSPDGKKIVTGSGDATAKIWDASSGQILTDLVGHETMRIRGVISVQFSPDGKKIVTASEDKTAKIWDAGSGQILADLARHTSAVWFAQFSPDGKKIFTASEDGIGTIWDARSGQILANDISMDYGIESAQFSPDGKKIITYSGGSGTVTIWDANSGQILAGPAEIVYSFTSAQFSPDGKKIVTASKDGTAKIWDASSGKYLAILKQNTSAVWDPVFSPDGKKIVATSEDGTVKIWDANSGLLLANLKGHKKSVSSAQFSPDGKKIVTASEDGTAKIWNVSSRLLLADLKGHKKGLSFAQFTSDGKKIITTSLDTTTKIWDASSGQILADFKGHNEGLNLAQISLDGQKIITTYWDTTTKIWDASSGQIFTDFKEHIFYDYSSLISISPDGKKIITSLGDETAKIWDTRSGQILADLKGHSSKINSAEFSPDGKKIVTASEDNTCKIWNAETGEILYTFLEVDSTGYLIVDNYNRYDGNEAGRKLVYFVCNDEVIELDQVKDQLWVPNLTERILNGDSINAKTLDELNICSLTPEMENMSSNEKEYHFKILPRRGGLGETVLYINNIELKRYKPEQLQKNGEVYELVIKKDELQNYFIAGKENPVTVKAYTADNAIFSRGLIVKEDKTKDSTVAPSLYAVMVGVSDYKGDELDLKYAAKDATDISNAVAVASKKLLNGNGKEHVFMYNLTTNKDRYQLPEKNSIKKTLEEIGKKATANDILLIFFAGHGVMQGPSDKKQFYFLTADASKSSAVDATAEVGISTAELIEWMKPSNIKAQKRIMIFDACNSGQAIRDFVQLGKPEQGYVAARNDDKSQQIKAIEKLNNQSGVFILAASASDQSAYELGRYSQGLLTYSLLKVIKQQPDVLENGKYLDVSNWLNAAKKIVSNLAGETGARQEPQLNASNNFNIGVVDEEVRNKIILPFEKPMFTRSDFRNTETTIDNLKLRSLVDKQLISLADETAASIMYSPEYEGQQVYQLSGSYTVSGTTISVSVIITQGGTEIKTKFTVTGTTDQLNELAKSITVKVFEWLKKKK